MCPNLRLVLLSTSQLPCFTIIVLDTPGVYAGKVVVRVSLRNQQPTITWEEFTFFDVTEPRNCLTFGPGVLSGCAPGTPTVFYIQVRCKHSRSPLHPVDPIVSTVWA